MPCAEAGYARRIRHLLCEKLLWRQWARPWVIRHRQLDFFGRRSPRDDAACAGIPIRTCPGYRERTGRADQVGQSPSVVNRYRPDPLTQQFSFGFQYAFTPNDVLDVNYVGSRGRRITLGGMNYGQLNPSYLSMGSALNNVLPNNPYADRLSQPGLPPRVAPTLWRNR